MEYLGGEYSCYLKMSTDFHILVEGKSDKYFLLCYFDELQMKYPETSKLFSKITIDKVEKLQIDSPISGNKNKIIHLSDKNPESPNLLCIIDREYDLFDFDSSSIRNKFKHNFIKKNLAMTDGHSFENYFFTLNIVKKTLLEITLLPICKNLEDKLCLYFEDLLRISCALGIASRKSLISWRRISPAINAEWFQLSAKKCFLNFESVSDSLENKGMSTEEIELIRQEYGNALKLINKSSAEILQHLCHAHLTTKMLFEFFSKIIFVTLAEHPKPDEDFDPKKSLQSKFRKVGEDDCVLYLSKNWAKHEVNLTASSFFLFEYFMEKL